LDVVGGRLAGALLATLRWGNFHIDPEARKQAYRGVLKFAGLNLILGFALSIVGSIDNYGHMGGLIAGLIAGAVLSRRLGWSPEAVRYRTIAWIVLIATLTMVYTSARKSRSFIPPFYAIEQDLQAQRYDAAIPKLQRFTQQYPDIYEGHILLGKALSAKQEYSAAARAYDRAADVLPNSPQPLLMKAAAHRAAGELLQAEATLRRLVSLVPQSAEAHALLGNMLADEKKFAEAELELKKTVELNPRSGGQVWLALGNVQLQLKKPSEAKESLEKALTAGADEAVVLKGMIQASEQLRDSEGLKKYKKRFEDLERQRAEDAKKAMVYM
jgi:tetratricopeptide (TPR) repeat protein